MNILTSKIDDNTIEVVKTQPAEVLPAVKYEYSFLLKQLEDITKQRDIYVEAGNKEIVEVEYLLAECAKLGITAKVVEPVEVVEEATP